MELRDSPEEAAFRERVRVWLAENISEEWRRGRSSQRGMAALSEELGEVGALEFAKDWHRRLYDAGFIGLSWPEEYGGQGLSPTLQFIYREEYAKAKPPPTVNTIGLGWAGPAIIHHGSEEQKARYLPRILTGEEVWCQLFSEPGAGSDLAGLSTKAERQDGGFVVNGQKVWTSLARGSDFGILVARTDPEAPKHRGLSFFICPMDGPGVEMRPIRQMNGSDDFNEVFLTDVFLPRENLIGDLNDGWRVTLTTLMHERIGLSLAPGSLWGQGTTADDLVELFRKDRGTGRFVDDPVLRDRMAEVYVEATAHRMLKLRLVTEEARGGVAGVQASIQKAFGDVWGQRLNTLAVDAQGLGGIVTDGPWAADDGTWQGAFLFSPALTIGGGTTEVQKNILGERILGLPKEPR